MASSKKSWLWIKERKAICVWLSSGHLEQQNEQLIYKQIYREKTEIYHIVFSRAIWWDIAPFLVWWQTKAAPSQKGISGD